MEPEAAGLRAALRWAGPGALLALGLALAACGGASAPATPLTPGLYSGTSATGQNLTVLTLADGTFWGASSSTPQASGTSTLTLARTSGVTGGACYDPDTRVLQLLARRPSDNPIGFFATGPN